MANVTEADIVAAKWRHGPTCQYHSFNDSPCTCGAVQAFAAHRIEAAKAERDRLRGTLEHIIETADALTTLSARVETLEAALREIDRMNDHPKWFRIEMDRIVQSALAGDTNHG